MIASIYVRLSEDKHGDQLGIDRQVGECREFCERQGWEVGEVFVDNDLSATTGVLRPGFEALLSSSPEVIVCWHTDRLVRLSVDLERVLELKVNVYGLKAGHLDLSTPAGRAVARTITAWSQYEGEQKGERQRSAARQRAASGARWWPRRPFGFEMDGRHHPAESEALRGAYASVLTGGTLTGIAREWQRAGFLTNTGRQWRAGSIRPVLLNARNAGIRVYLGEEVGPAAWDPIVPEETYRAVVRLLGAPERRAGGGRGGRGRRENLLTGLAECGVCGSGVRAAYRGQKGQPGAYKVYLCSARQHVTQRAAFLESLVETTLFSWLLRRDAASLVLADGSGRAEELSEELTRLRQRLDGIMDDYADGEITKEERNRMAGRVRERIAATERELAGLGMSRTVAELLDVADLDREWAEAYDMNRKHAIVAAFFDRVVLKPRGKGANAPKLEDVELWLAGADEPLQWVAESPLHPVKG